MTEAGEESERVGDRALFVGRSEELTLLTRFRAAAAEGTPSLVVVEGDAGVGKTALAQQALAPGPDGLIAVWARCDRVEQDWPYAVLDQWLRRLPRGTDGLHELSALTRRGAPPLAVGQELLGVLAAVSDAAPLGLVVDDVPWADEQSLATLGFVLRRLWSERLLVVVTARSSPVVEGSAGETGADDSGNALEWRALARSATNSERILLRGLSAAEAGELARARTGTALNDASAARLLERTGGNPLHLRTLLGQVTARELQDMTGSLPIPASLEVAINHQLNALPADSLRLVEALAVLETQVPLPLAGRLAGLSDPATALGPALWAGLVAWDADEPTTPVRLQHALQRDAIYQSLAPPVRRELHKAAAGLVGEDAAWAHRVAAADYRDAVLADGLATEADRQIQAGRVNRAATLLLWAADLAPTRLDHEEHLIAAVTALLSGFAYTRARVHRDAVAGCAPSPLRDAVLGHLAMNDGDLGSAERYLARALSVEHDATVAVLAGTWLGMVYLWQADGPRAASVLRRTLADCDPVHAHRVRGMLSFAVGFSDGPRAGLHVIEEAGLPAGAADVSSGDTLLLRFRGTLRVLAGELQEGIDDLTSFIARSRASTQTFPGHIIEYYILSFAQYLTGRLDDAAINADQALLIADAEGQTLGFAPAHAAAATVSAQQGNWPKAQAASAACEQWAAVYPSQLTFFPPLARAVRAQAQGDHAAVVSTLMEFDDEDGLQSAYSLLWLPLLVEALTATDRPGRPSPEEVLAATTATRRFADLASKAPALTLTAEWLRGRLAAARGDTGTALTHYRAGLNDPSRATGEIALHRAFLRRDLARLLITLDGHEERAEALDHLRHAAGYFTAIGAVPHAQRCNEILPPQGPPSDTERPPDPLTALTEREHATAHLASQGMTNPEIARELFVSPKTVEYHLGKVYTKLGLTSRRELSRLLEPRQPAGS